MVEIKGKRRRKVRILLTRDVKKAIDVLVEKCGEVGVNAHLIIFSHLTEGSKL